MLEIELPLLKRPKFNDHCTFILASTLLALRLQVQ